MARLSAMAILLLACSMCVGALYVLYPHTLSEGAGALHDLYSCLSAWLTPPLLFLVMNAVVCALFFTSSLASKSTKRANAGRFRGRRHHGVHSGQFHHRYNQRREIDGAEGQGNRENEDQEDAYEEESEGSMDPEFFTFFFGERSSTHRTKGSDIPPSPSRSERALLLSHGKLQNLGSGTGYGRSKASSDGAPKSEAMHLRSRTAATSAGLSLADSNGKGQDVDERADDFIGNFYMKMKMRQADPYKQMLERSA